MITRLHNEGDTPDRIARKLGLTRAEVRAALKAAGPPDRKSSPFRKEGERKSEGPPASRQPSGEHWAAKAAFLLGNRFRWDGTAAYLDGRLSTIPDVIREANRHAKHESERIGKG